MILKTSFRRPGGLSDHLGRNDTNERVEILAEHCVAVEPDLKSAVQLFAAIGTAFGIERNLIHFVISPGRELLPPEIARCLDEIRTQYGLAANHPLLLLQHTKPGRNRRPKHLHAVAPRKHPESGITIKDSWSRRTDQKIARILEYTLGHDLISGRFNHSIAKEIESTYPDLAEKLHDLEAPMGRAVDRKVGAQAEAAKTDLAEFDRRVFAAWTQAGRDQAFELGHAGLSLAQGDKLIRVVDDLTGFNDNFRRVLAREAKRQGQRLSLKEADLKSRFPRLQPLEQVRAEVMRRASLKLRRGIEREFSFAIADSIAQGDPKAAKHLREERENYERDAANISKATLIARREAIWAAFRLRNKLRQERVERALAAARIRRTKLDAQAVFGLVAGGAILAGVGVGAAIAAGAAVTLVLAGRRVAAMAVERPSTTIGQVKAERAADLQATRAESRRLIRTPSRDRGRNSRGGPGRG